MTLRTLFLILLMSLSRTALAETPTLAELETSLARDYAAIGHMTPQELAARLAAGEDIILLDARAKKEYAVGHIPGAIRVSPKASGREVARLLGDRANGATIVVYCSVGVRSSILADRSAPALQAAGAASVWNLRGGVFAWHNEARPLADANGPTPYVHPYDAGWGALLTHPEHMAYRPGGG